jgi:energy-coupling factor transport system substrate-specific component
MKRILKSLFLSFFIVLFFIIPNKSNAHEYLSDKSETVYDNLTGLATGKANTVTQTENGYIWIGQYAGLTKYNSKFMCYFIL